MSTFADRARREIIELRSSASLKMIDKPFDSQWTAFYDILSFVVWSIGGLLSFAAAASYLAPSAF